jgi:hypothetical protein
LKIKGTKLQFLKIRRLKVDLSLKLYTLMIIIVKEALTFTLNHDHLF